jgi:FkbM family methyltransferase
MVESRDEVIANRIDRALFRSLPSEYLKEHYIRIASKIARRTRKTALIQLPTGPKLVVSRTDYIGTFLHYFGVWEPCITKFIVDNIRSGSVFIDIGANVGYYTLLASSLVGQSGKVLAFEPSPSIFKMLGRNIELNNCSNVELFSIGISDREKMADFYMYDGNIGHSSFIPSDSRYRLEARVALKPLTAVVSPADISRAQMLKIDVEGSESEVLHALIPMLDTLPNAVKILCEVKLNGESKERKNVRRALQEYAKRGFFIYKIANEYNINFYQDLPESPMLSEFDMTMDGLCDVILSREPLD